ncbi:MAG: acyltransferase [Clostridia bacterium]|nr:acyltransferase [Clostridia bacterium]
MTSFYSEEELKQLGFASVGKNVSISRKASFYSPSEISLGNDVRIDDFCILSGKVSLGNNIHIAAYSAIYGGKEGVFISNYANVSSRVCIYAVSDDFSGETMTNPTIPDKYKKLINGKVIIKQHVIIGSGCTVLPDTVLEEGSAFGCMSLIKTSSSPWTIYAGIPCRKIKDRKKDLLLLAKKYEKEYNK